MTQVQSTAGLREVLEYSPPNMIVWWLPDTDRAKEIMSCDCFYHGTQHSHHKATWSGAEHDPGVGYLRARLKPQGFVPTNSAATIPYGVRRPDAPSSLHRQIVTRFTDMLLGETSRPNLAVPADPDTEAYIHAIMEESDAWAALQQARDIKGRARSAAIAVSVVNGEPAVEALHPADLWVREWEDEAKWVPRVVVEQKIVAKTEERDPDDGSGVRTAGRAQLERVRYWRTRVWTDEYAITYEDVPYDWADEDPERPIPVESIVEHRAGRCPVVWMQNTRNLECPDGEEDYVNTYEVSDKLDTLRAFTCRSAIANTDPTTIVKDTPARLRRHERHAKGHGQKISVDTAGDVKLLEASGDPVRTSMELAKMLRHDILQTAGAVIAEPETLGTYKSAESIRLMLKPMEAKAGRLRIPLACEIRQLCSIWIELGRAWGVDSIEEYDGRSESSPILLPPRVEIEEGEGDEDDREVLSVHSVGEGRWIDVQWGPYLRPTPSELLAVGQALTIANGQKPLISQCTATSVMTSFLGAGSPDHERSKIESEKEEAVANFGGGDPRDGLGKSPISESTETEAGTEPGSDEA